MKKVTFLPYPAAINLPPHTPIIAIGNPGQVYKYQQEYVHKLDVRFSDEVLKEGDATFTLDQAEQRLFTLCPSTACLWCIVVKGSFARQPLLRR